MSVRFHVFLIVVVTLAMAAPSSAAPGGLGELCDTASPCGSGLTCRDGFCLRLHDDEAPPPPAAKAPAPPAEAPALPAPESFKEPEPPSPAPPSAAAPSSAASPPAAAPAPVDEDNRAPLQLPEPSAAAEPPAAEPPAAEDLQERAGLAEDAAGQVWGAAGARAISSPALLCGGCLLGAGACTTLGGLTFLEAANRGAFTEFSSSNDNARIGGYIGLAVGIVATLTSAPFVLVGESAALYAAFLDASLCGSSLGLDDGLLTALAAGHGVTWTLAPQLLGCGAALFGSGAWVWVAANGVNAYPDTDRDARTLLNGYAASGTAMLMASTIPIGLGCLLGLAGIGLDFGAVMRANALEDQALQTQGSASSASPEAPFLAAASRGSDIAY